MAKIKLSDDIIVSSNSLQAFIDTGNVLYDSSGTWTATEDCVVFQFYSGSTAPFKIGNGYGQSGYGGVLARAGSKVNNSGSTIRAFGLK